MTQNSTKIQGKFYPLQHEEWLRAWESLKKPQATCFLALINVAFEEVQ